MSQRRLFSGLIKITIIFLMLLVYFSFYFIPSIKKINHFKRETKTLRLMVRDHQKKDIHFVFLTDTEKKLFARIDREFWARFRPKSNQDGESDLRNYWQHLAASIEQLGRKLQLQDLKMIDQELISAGRDDSRFLSYVKMKRMELKRANAQKNHNGALEGAAARDGHTTRSNSRWRPLFVAFKGNLVPALKFINRLGSADIYMRINDLFIDAGSGDPDYFLCLLVPRPRSYDGEGSMPEFFHFQGQFYVDSHSEILLQEVQAKNIERFPFKELAPFSSSKLDQRLKCPAGSQLSRELKDLSALCGEAAIFKKDGRGFALIKGLLYQVGDPIAGGIISSIFPHQITIRFSDRLQVCQITSRE